MQNINRNFGWGPQPLRMETDHTGMLEIPLCGQRRGQLTGYPQSHIAVTIEDIVRMHIKV